MKIDAVLDAIERLAFDMKPPNHYTPQFVQMVIVAREALRSERNGVAADETPLERSRRLERENSEHIAGQLKNGGYMPSSL